MGEIGLVAQRQHVARVEPRVLAQARDHERAALAQHDRIALRLLLRLRQPLQRNEPRVVGAGMRDHAEAVGAEKDRAAAFLAVGGVDPGRHCRGGLAALRRLAEAAGNQHHRFHRAGRDDLVDEAVDRIGGDRDDQEVELVRERREARGAFDAVDLRLAGADDGQALLRIPAAHQVAQDDAAEIHAGRRNPDDADRRRMEQLVDLVDGAGQAAGDRARRTRSARRARSARSPTCTGSSVERPQHERRCGIGRARRCSRARASARRATGAARPEAARPSRSAMRASFR